MGWESIYYLVWDFFTLYLVATLNSLTLHIFFFKQIFPVCAPCFVLFLGTAEKW